MRDAANDVEDNDLLSAAQRLEEAGQAVVQAQEDLKRVREVGETVASRRQGRGERRPRHM